MQIDNWDALVNSIVDSILNKIERESPKDEHVAGTLALFTTYVASPKTAGKTLVSLYGEDVECALIGDADFDAYGFRHTEVREEADRKALVQKAASKGRIVLVTPKVSLLQKIAEGNDDGFVEHIMLRSLLWGRQVCILLDFDRPRFRRGTFFQKMGEIIDSLTSMGILIHQYQCQGEEEAGTLTLVTEREIEQAHREGKLCVLCAGGAIVTPLAKEKAADLGITIDGI